MDSARSSIHQDDLSVGLPSLDTLVGHLLAAKRSLACVEHVSRANSLVTSTRTALEIQTAHNARAEFLRGGCYAQIRVLRRIQAHTRDLVHDSKAEHLAIVGRLDQADRRLTETLESLRSTMVEQSLRPDSEEPKSLADFVDEMGVQGLRETITAAFGSFDSVKRDFEDMGKDLDDDIARAQGLLGGKGSPQLPRSVIPAYLTKMENSAHEMANNLESLVKHFDLCITAIKHTEGGGAAASKITNDLPERVRMQLERSDALEPIEPEERREMLDVLQKDAGEVDEVVSEIRETLAEMEADYEQVEAAMGQQADQAQRTAAALKLLEETGAKLPRYTTQSQLFIIRWEEDRAKIEDHLVELDGLRDFYAGFIDAYNNLIIEVGRRKDTEKRIEKIRRDAVAKIDKLLAEEVAERQHFRQAQGDFLPVDIWPGLMTSPAKYEFIVTEGTEDSLPDISASTIKRAIKSLEGATRSAYAK